MLLHLEKKISRDIIHVAIRYLQPISLQSRLCNPHIAKPSAQTPY
jgi:hypothetical protein